MNRQSGSAVELLLILFVTLLLFVGTVFWGLLPAMEQERSADQRLRQLEQKIEMLQKEYGTLYSEKQRQSADVKRESADLPDAAAVASWLQAMIPSAGVAMDSNARFAVTGVVDSPLRLYQMFDALEKEPWNLEAVLPLTMEQTAEGIRFSCFFAAAGTPSGR